MPTSSTPPGRAPRAVTRAGALVALALALAPLPATARPYRSQFELSRGQASEMDRVGVFVEWNWAQMDYNAKFDINGSDAVGGFSSDITYKARGLGTQSMVPRFGLTYAKSERLLLEGSVGLSFYDFEERLVQSGFYDNEHQALTSSELRPGLSLEAGALYTWRRFGDFAAILGARATYRSASKSSGDDVRATFSGPGGSTTFHQVTTDEVNVRTLALTGSAGLEWRPRNTWLVNHFGVALAAAYTFGSLEHRVKTTNGLGALTSDLRSEVDVGMTPSDWLGVYYGWSLFYPRVGVFSLEGQFLAEPRVTLTYEYLF